MFTVGESHLLELFINTKLMKNLKEKIVAFVVMGFCLFAISSVNGQSHIHTVTPGPTETYVEITIGGVLFPDCFGEPTDCLTATVTVDPEDPNCACNRN